jgi:hypothetical protein
MKYAVSVSYCNLVINNNRWVGGGTSTKFFFNIQCVWKLCVTIRESRRIAVFCFQTSALERFWGVGVTPRQLSTPGKDTIHIVQEAWVGPSAGLDRCGKLRPHEDSITGPSSPWPVAIPTDLPGPLWNTYPSLILSNCAASHSSFSQICWYLWIHDYLTSTVKTKYPSSVFWPVYEVNLRRCGRKYCIVHFCVNFLTYVGNFCEWVSKGNVVRCGVGI